jgi:hypothetical protein
MNTTPASFSLDPTEHRIKPGNFFREVYARLSRRILLQTGLIGFFFSIYNTVYWSGAEGQTLHFYLVGHLPINLGGAYFMLLALLCGDTAVASGARPFWAYLLPLSLSALLFAYLQWQIHLWWVIPADPDGVEAEIMTQPAQLYNVALDLFRTGGVIAFVYINRRLAVANLRRLQGARLQREESEKAIVNSRLQAMQARVEPELLSNTLRQVGSLYETRPAHADALLENLIAYLRATLPQLRERASTLARECQLAQAYFNLFCVTRQIGCAIDATAEAEDASFPPMLLLPLMSHVLAQGLPSPEPVTLRVCASVRGRRLQVLVESTPPTTAIGSMTVDISPMPIEIKERLQTLYGTDAALTSESPSKSAIRSPIRYSLEIPYEAYAYARAHSA